MKDRDLPCPWLIPSSSFAFANPKGMNFQNFPLGNKRVLGAGGMHRLFPQLELLPSRNNQNINNNKKNICKEEMGALPEASAQSQREGSPTPKIRCGVCKPPWTWGNTQGGDAGGQGPSLSDQ